MESNLKESSWSRAKRDSKRWLLDHILAWFLAFLLPGIGTVLVTWLIPLNADVKVIALFGFFGGLAGLLLLLGITYSWNSFRAPYKQRNEAQQRIEELESESNKPKLFDILCQTTSIGLPINRLDDGSYQASAVKLGIQPLLLVHRGELTTITSFVMFPVITFLRVDGWETTDAIQITPGINLTADARTEIFTWDTKKPQQWELTGLPLTMAKDELITLPTMMLSVANGNEAGAHFDRGETCTLTMKFAIRTDKGFPTLPDKTISITKNDIRDSLKKLGVQFKPQEGTIQ